MYSQYLSEYNFCGTFLKHALTFFAANLCEPNGGEFGI